MSSASVGLGSEAGGAGGEGEARAEEEGENVEDVEEPPCWPAFASPADWRVSGSGVAASLPRGIESRFDEAGLGEEPAGAWGGEAELGDLAAAVGVVGEER